jgi:hypothetical protein
VLREEKDVAVDGVTEKWRLEWPRPPVPDCIDESWSGCNCAGFELGEKGDLDLVRTRQGAGEERLHLGPLFLNHDGRMRRWPVTKKDTGKVPDISELVTRPIETVIKLADYDHDGRATEFVLNVGAGPCGHTQAVVVGISKTNGKLHAFGTKESPDTPLVLEHAKDWEKLKSGSSADVVQGACGEASALEETKLHVTADGDLRATATKRKCP